MTFVVIAPTRYQPDAPLTTGLFGDIVGNENYFNGLIVSQNDANGAPLVLNGSFESPSVASSTTPNDWTIVNGDAGAAVLSNAQQIHGAQSLKFTRDSTNGHTGGTATSSGFFNVSQNLSYQFIFMLLSSRTDVSNSVVINWYDASQGSLGSTTVYSATSSPTTWRDYRYLVTPVANACFGKIVISGGTTATTPGATASIYFDAFSFELKPSFSSQAGYTSTTSFTANGSNAGAWKIKMWGKRNATIASGSMTGAGGGYAEAIIWMRVGDTATLTITSGASASFVFNGRDGSTTLAVGAGTASVNGTATQSGVASGGYVLIQGGSMAEVARVSIEN